MPPTITFSAGQAKTVQAVFVDASGNPVPAPGSITMDIPATLISVAPDPGGDPTKFLLTSLGLVGSANLKTYASRNNPGAVSFDTTIEVVAGPAVDGQLVVIG